MPQFSAADLARFEPLGYAELCFEFLRRFATDIPAETLRGRVKDIRLAATTVQNVVTYTVVVTAPNAAGRLLPGMTATLRIVTEERPEALRVPNAALRWRPPGTTAGGQPAEAAAPGQAQLDQALAALTDLTPAQRAEIDVARAEMRQRMQSLPADADARRQQAQAARQRLVSRLNGALTPDQRARLAALRAGGSGRGGQPGTVWVMDAEGPPRSVAVRTGITDGTVTEILSGQIEPGATLVIGQDRAGSAAAAAGRRLF
jgi:HlyD family secretion protein